jgi:long-chain acyl-CoA synthetase
VVGDDTLAKAFLRTAAANADVVALRRMSAAGEWQETTYGQMRDEVARVAAGLRAAGLGEGQRMVLMMRNRPEFHVVDLAATFLRATPVSIYNSSSPEELQYLVAHAAAEIAVIEDAGFLERFLKVRNELPALRRIFVIEPPADAVPDGVAPYEELLAADPADLEELGRPPRPAIWRRSSTRPARPGRRRA